MNYLEVIGLSFNFVGALVLAIPLLKSQKQFDSEKDRLIDLGTTKDGAYKYTTKREQYSASFARWGAVLMVIGFLIQLLAII